MTAEDLAPIRIVIIGHIDHGKSTLMGRLLADCGSLPDGKLEQIQRFCQLNKKTFEYSFLLDSLKDEQDQGITIEMSRCHFKVHDRHYLMFDAPGHIEFLKNMLTGASCAEAALLVIDAKEGIQENSRRHCYMVSFLGIKQIVVIINKMDLVNFQEDVFCQVKEDFGKFLTAIKVTPLAFIPISAKYGKNVSVNSPEMPWYKGPTVLEIIESFAKELPKNDKPFRFPVQDVYKFTEDENNRRVVAGTVETGTVRSGDEVIFLPSRECTRIKTIERFPQSLENAIQAGYATGFTLSREIYVKPGDVMCKTSEPLPEIGTSIRANIFWIGKNPLSLNRQYKIKIGTSSVGCYLAKINNVMEGSELKTRINKQQIDQNEVADCVFQTLKPIVFDLEMEIVSMRRFVIIDKYWIAGGGIIIENVPNPTILPSINHFKDESLWERSTVSNYLRIAQFHQKPAFIIISGNNLDLQGDLAKSLEEELILDNYNAYYLGFSKLKFGLHNRIQGDSEKWDENIEQLRELAQILTDAGLIFISNVPELNQQEVAILKSLTGPTEILFVHNGANSFSASPVNLHLPNITDVKQALKLIKGELLREQIIVPRGDKL